MITKIYELNISVPPKACAGGTVLTMLRLQVSAEEYCEHSSTMCLIVDGVCHQTVCFAVVRGSVQYSVHIVTLPRHLSVLKLYHTRRIIAVIFILEETHTILTIIGTQ